MNDRIREWATRLRLSAALERAVVVLGCLLVGIFTITAISGQLLFARTPDDVPSSADVVIVLGGEHDGREVFGIRLAQRLDARAVVLSNPYPRGDELMRELCAESRNGIKVFCVRPDPLTTRGEAIAVRELAIREGWDRIVLVSWRYHLLRAKFIFHQCYSDTPGRVGAIAVPGHENLPFAVWQQIFLYQFAAMAKALTQGECDSTI